MSEAIDVLVQFSRLASAAGEPGQILPLLADAARTHLGVAAAAVLEITDDDRVTLVAGHNLPAALASWSGEADIGPALGARLVAAAGPPLAHAQVIPLVSGGSLFGVLVLLDPAPIALDPARGRLVEALVDLAAIASQRAADYAELARSYADLRESRDALARTERLRVLGQMAGGVSHDLKNILNPLGLQLELLRRKCERRDHDAALASIQTMREVIAHGVDVVERLREFSRQEPDAMSEEVDLERVVATAIELSRPQVTQHALFLHHRRGEPPPVGARASELTTAIVNLIVNATEATPAGGAITLATGASDDGGWVEVADDGPGMTPEIQARVFEPFFTTKDAGTGLGLAMVYAFVGRHRGKVTLDSAPGAGTRFRMWFPRFARSGNEIPA